jgi:gliding motility-associated-like protein
LCLQQTLCQERPSLVSKIYSLSFATFLEKHKLMKFKHLLLALCTILAFKAQAQFPECDTNAIKTAFSGYTRLYVAGNSCAMYFISNTPKTAASSEQDVIALGAHVSSIKDATENAAIVAAATAQGITGDAWIGFTDYVTEGTWQAIDQSGSTYTNWAAGQPSNSANSPCYSDEDAASINLTTGLWDDKALLDVCGTVVLRAIVKVDLCPVITVTPSATVCAGQPANIQAIGKGGSRNATAPSYTYSWFIPPSFVPVDQDSVFSQTVPGSGSVAVLIQDRYQCPDTAIVAITVDPCVQPTGPKGCNTTQITTTFTNAGYIPLNVPGQPCSMYFVNPTSQDAAQAEAAANTYGAHTVVFNNAQENTDVVNALSAANIFSQAPDGTIWIGYKRSAVGSNYFYALDGSTGDFLTATTGGPTPGIYQNWNGAEPNNNGYQDACVPPFGCSTCSGVKLDRCTNGENCVQIFGSGLWNDLPCATSSWSVIEVNLCPQTTETNDTTVCANALTTLKTTTILGSQPYTYQWTPGGKTTQNITETIAANTTYYVKVTDRYSCYSEDTINVTTQTCTIPTGPQGCDIQQILNNYTTAGYIPLNVSGQPCSMYFVNPNSQDAAQAEASAQTLGGHTVVFNDAAENTNVVAALNAQNIFGTYGGTVWIGYKRTATNASTFYALDGSTGPFLTPTTGGPTPGIYQNWSGGEPNNSGYNNCTFGCNNFTCSDKYKCNNGEQCVQIYTAGTWNDLGCDEQSVSVIEVNLCPEVNGTTNNATLNGLDKDTTVCSGTNVTLKTNPILGSTPYAYTWNPSGKTTQSITEAPTQSTTYISRVTDRWGCYGQDTLTINIISPTNPGFTLGRNSICDGDTTSVTLNGTPSGASYVWNFAGGTVISGTGAGPYVVSWAGAGNKNITLDINGGCVIPQASQSLTVKPLPVANAGADAAVCSGGSIQIGTAPQANYTYQWFPLNNLSSVTVPDPLYSDTNTSNAPITNEYYVAAILNGCIDFDTIVITTNPPQPTAVSPAGPTINFCYGGDTVLTSAQPFASILWNTGATTPSITVNTDASFSFTAVDANGCQFISDTVNTVESTIPLLTTISTAGAIPVCLGGHIVINSDSVYNNYVWSEGSTTPSITVTQADTIIMQSQNTDGCWIVSNPIIVTYNANPLPSVIKTDSAISFCQGESAILYTDSTYVSYTWSTAETTPQITVSQTGAYSLGSTDTANCIYLSNTINVTANPLPLVNSTQITDQQCFGVADGSISVAGSVGTAPFSYTWDNGLTGSPLSGLNPGTYIVTVTDANSCTGQNTFTVNPAILLELILDSIKDVTCFEGSDGVIATHASGGAPGYTYFWSNGSTSGSATKLTANTYDLTVTDANGCFIDTSFEVIQPEKIEILAPDTTGIVFGGTGTLDVTVTPATGNYTYVWTPKVGLSCDTCAAPVATPVKTTDYTVVVTNEAGCTSELEFTYVVDASKLLYIPNLFTPNSDGKNDFWCIYSYGVKTMDLKIFNRIGEKVFESTDINTCWDGYYNGIVSLPGVYVYYVKLSYADETWTQRQGSITIYR